jgi:hypothetical protein
MSTIDPRALNWIMGGDKGSSSETIWAVMTGAECPRPSRPLDASDFGRCYRLLALIPEWRVRLPEVTARYPEWGPLVAIWGELEVLWQAVGCNGPFDGEWNLAASKRLYERMQAVDRACMIAGGWVETGPGSWRRGGDTQVTLGKGVTSTFSTSKGRK